MLAVTPPATSRVSPSDAGLDDATTVLPDAQAPFDAEGPSSAADAPLVSEGGAPACTAVLRGGGHLRPRATTFSVGPMLPAGTAVAVLSAAEGVRRESARGIDDPAILAHVRVIEGGADGWAFVRASELSDACPIRTGYNIVQDAAARREHVDATCRRPRRLFTRAGAFRSPGGPIRCGTSATDEVVARVDATGDGRVDEVLQLHGFVDPDCNRNRDDGDGTFDTVTVLRWRDAAGWHASHVAITGDLNGHGGNDANHTSTAYTSTIEAGNAVYFRVEVTPAYGMYRCVDLPARVGDQRSHIELLRWHPCGVVVDVAQLSELIAGGCRWSGLADGSLRVDCERPARSLTLRWNEALFRLEPEGDALPEEPLQRLCHHDWEH